MKLRRLTFPCRYDSDDRSTYIFCLLYIAPVLAIPTTPRVTARSLLALAIDLRRLTSPWRYDGDERFPHIYGPLNRDAVLAVPPAPRAPDGTFLPPTWADPTYAPEDIPFTTPKVGVNAVIFDDAGRI